MSLNKNYFEIYKKKLERYDFKSMLKESGYGDEIVKAELSEEAYKFICECSRDIYFNKEFLKDFFILKNLPMHKKVIDFFAVYGGRAFCYESEFLWDTTIRISEGYRIKSFPERVEERDGNTYYECMDYHYAGDFGPHIDQDGRVYIYGMGKYYKEADSMAEFMEQQWIKAVANREKLSAQINGIEEKKYYLEDRHIKRQGNILQNLYEALIRYSCPEVFKMMEPLISLILEKEIVLDDEQVEYLMSAILRNQNISEELIMNVLEFLSIKDCSLSIISAMLDVAETVTLKERKEQFLIDKLIQLEDEYPEVKLKIMKLL